MESDEAPKSAQETPAATDRRVRTPLVAVVVLGLVVGIFWWTGLGSYLAQRQGYARKTATFAGSSDSLQQTAIVPTLDSPCPANKNVVWCSSFQMAWNEVRDKVVGAPLEVAGARETAARLNAARQSGSDLEAKSFYATGGWIKDDIVGKIKKDMATRFPSHTPPDFNELGSGILAYSYLTAGVPFQHPFEQTKLTFRNSAGEETEVEAFGVWNLLQRYDKIRKQVEILHYRRSNDKEESLAEFVVDLCHDAGPYQVVIAVVPPKNSLAETLAYIRSRREDFKKNPYYEHERQLGRVDDLKVPEMFWRIDHRFQELIGKVVGNVGLPIVEAMQTMEFRLDRSGAVLEAESRYRVAAIPRFFVFNRPFLVYMQKRGAAHPFFAMWVDNAELLTHK